MPGTKPRNKRGSTRTRMLVSAVEVLRECGAAGVTIDAVLTRSGAPRGSVYHHFPGGRQQILAEALQFAGDSISALIDERIEDGGLALVRRFVTFWEGALADSNYTAGCPVVAAAIAATDDEPHLAVAASDIFTRWRESLGRAFAADGFEESDAASLAVMCIAALEGAVVLCRTSRSADALRDVLVQLEFLIRTREFVLHAARVSR